MEIEDTFEEWEGSDIEEIEGLKVELAMKSKEAKGKKKAVTTRK